MNVYMKYEYEYIFHIYIPYVWSMKPLHSLSRSLCACGFASRTQAANTEPIHGKLWKCMDDRTRNRKGRYTKHTYIGTPDTRACISTSYKSATVRPRRLPHYHEYYNSLMYRYNSQCMYAFPIQRIPTYNVYMNTYMNTYNEFPQVILNPNSNVSDCIISLLCFKMFTIDK